MTTAANETRKSHRLLAARWEVFLDVSDEAREAGWSETVLLSAKAWRAMFGHCSYPEGSAGPEQLVRPERRGLVELLEAAHNDSRRAADWEVLWTGAEALEFTPPPIIALGGRTFGTFHIVKAEAATGPAAYRVDLG